MDESGSQSTTSGGDTYAEDRRRRLHRDRLVGFVLCIALWVLSVVPLARESMHGRGGLGAVAVYLAVGAITLGVAAVIRGLYFLLRRQHFWSPWVFLLAAVLALAGYAVQNAGPGGLISAPRFESALSEHGPPVVLVAKDGATGSATVEATSSTRATMLTAEPQCTRAITSIT